MRHFHDHYTDAEEATDVVYTTKALIGRLTVWMLDAMIAELQDDFKDYAWAISILEYEFETLS